MAYEEYWERKRRRFLQAAEYLKEAGVDICREMESIIKGEAAIIKNLVETGDWKRVRTELERLIDYVEYLEFCRV